MSKWIAEFELEDGDTMPEHMDLEYKGTKIDFHCRPKEPILDKIRAEIEQLPTNTRTNWDGCCPDIDYPEIEYVDVTKAKLLEIIDKYKDRK